VLLLHALDGEADGVEGVATGARVTQHKQLTKGQTIWNEQYGSNTFACCRVEQEVAELKGPVEQEAGSGTAPAAGPAAAAAALDRQSSLGYGELAAAAPSEQELQRRQTLCDLQDDIEEVSAKLQHNACSCKQ
jgi:hypothetical protein